MGGGAADLDGLRPSIDNPALAAYISSAQKLHEASWKLQGDLIERQERQQKQLLDYKKLLEEQVEVRKREL